MTHITGTPEAITATLASIDKLMDIPYEADTIDMPPEHELPAGFEVPDGFGRTLHYATIVEHPTDSKQCAIEVDAALVMALAGPAADRLTVGEVIALAAEVDSANTLPGDWTPKDAEELPAPIEPIERPI